MIDKILNYFWYIKFEEKKIGKTEHEVFLSEPILPQYDKSIETWNEYWNKQCADLYDIFYVRNISKDPKILINLISAISEFDFKKTEEYMSKVNWTWNDDEKYPINDKCNLMFYHWLFLHLKHLMIERNLNVLPVDFNHF